MEEWFQGILKDDDDTVESIPRMKMVLLVANIIKIEMLLQ
jgi:hypothetical protein